MVAIQGVNFCLERVISSPILADTAASGPGLAVSCNPTLSMQGLVWCGIFVMSYELAGLQRNYISLIELGRNQPTITTLFRLSAALEISPSEILKEVEWRVISGLAG